MTDFKHFIGLCVFKSFCNSVFIEMKVSIEHLIDNIVTDEKKFNEITDYLFKLLERRSLFGAQPGRKYCF